MYDTLPVAVVRRLRAMLRISWRNAVGAVLSSSLNLVTTPVEARRTQSNHVKNDVLKHIAVEETYKELHQTFLYDLQGAWCKSC